MSHISTGHVEEDTDIARGIADALEAAGCRIWYNERDGPENSSKRAPEMARAKDACRNSLVCTIGGVCLKKEKAGRRSNIGQQPC